MPKWRNYDKSGHTAHLNASNLQAVVKQVVAAALDVDVGGQRIGRKRGGIDSKNYEPKFVEFSKGRIRQEVSLFFTFPPNLALILFSSEAMPFLPPRRKNIGMYQVLLTFKHYISPWLLWL